jgi:hypothetical protein
MRQSVEYVIHISGGQRAGLGNKGVRCPAYFVYLCYPSSPSHRIERVLGILGIVSGLGVEETGKPFLSRAG